MKKTIIVMLLTVFSLILVGCGKSSSSVSKSTTSVNQSTTINPTTITSTTPTTSNEERVNVTFRDYDGTILYEASIKKGTTPKYKGTTPQIESSEYFSYTFKGWYPSISKIDEDTVYTAIYNPTLIKSVQSDLDTDMDGMVDTLDPFPTSSTFYYSLYESSTPYVESFDFNYSMLIDGDNTEFNRELMKLSVAIGAATSGTKTLIENSINRSGSTESMLRNFGLKDIKVLTDKGSNLEYDKFDLYSSYVSHNAIVLESKKYEIIFVNVLPTDGSKEQWVSNFDTGSDTDEYYGLTGEHPDWLNKENHKGFDVCTNRLKAQLDEYISDYIDKDSEKIIYITGYSRGAAIANILGTFYEDDTEFKSFTYAAAVPCSTLSKKEYKTIYSLINETDLVAYLPLSEWGFGRYGREYVINCADYKSIYRDTLGSLYITCNIDSLKEAFLSISDNIPDIFKKVYSDECVFIDTTFASEEKMNQAISQYNKKADEVYSSDLIWFETSLNDDGTYSLKGYVYKAFVAFHIGYLLGSGDPLSALGDGMIPSGYSKLETKLAGSALAIASGHRFTSYSIISRYL